ncbi:acetate--CoA ligase family protein [Advenella sp. FME57]|uniref:acetate--CoA ligase family protein n=1 Tax=Advenella sp. FME57 TaxID=2742604 RepID=UPI001865E489|nr:acetate--CoA ligase family protein [Advenella sp. FME57]
MNTCQTLNSLFSPKSIAILGASNTAGQSGAVPIALLLEAGYAGKIYPVNPRQNTIYGLPCHACLSDIDDAIDLVIVAVPAAHVLAALEKSRPGQISNAVIFSSGFAEVGDTGFQLQQQLRAFAQERHIRLLGPNCLGFINVRTHTYATFSPAPLNGRLPAGDVGMVTQSGAFGAYAYCLARERHLGLSCWISTGNESDLDVADCIQWLVDDPDTNVIMAYIEGCKNGDKLKRALAAANNASKPVVVTKIGRTNSGALAAASHTAALAGDDAVYDALFKQYGAIRAYTIEEFFNVGQALSKWPRRSANHNLAIISISGGVGALMADEADEHRLNLPTPPDEVKARLLARIPFAGANNPVDVTGHALTDLSILLDTSRDLLSTGNYGALAIFLAAAGSSETLWPYLQELVSVLHTEYPDIPLTISALLPPERKNVLQQSGSMVFADPSVAIRTLSRIMRHRPAMIPAVTDGQSSVSPPEGVGALNEADSLALLNNATIPVIPFAVANSASEAQAIARRWNSPAVMKIVSADILHKSDVGGVKLGIKGDQAVSHAYDDILSSVQSKMPQAKIDGVLVAPMRNGGIECIMGVHRDAVFGPVVMFGLGGIFVEILKDVSFRLAPFDRGQALSMIQEIRATALLSGARGQGPADIPALADTLVALSRLAYEQREYIESIDINPILALPEGQGVLALDGVIIRNRTAQPVN